MILALLFMLVAICNGAVYEIVFQDNIFVPCKDNEDHFHEEYVTMPEKFTTSDDDKLIIQGDFIMVYDFAGKALPFVLDVFKKGRGGAWQKTIFGFMRDDLCKSLMNPTEMWSMYTKVIPNDQRVCPFYKGQKFSFDDLFDETIEMQSSTMEGEYLLHFEFGNHDEEDGVYFCMESHVNLYRV